VESQLPAGTVTFLFTDIEGSTDLVRELGDAYGEVLDEHRQILRDQLAGAGGREVDTQGDAFFFSFMRAREAVSGAVATQRALMQHEWKNGADVRVRIGLHTGEPAVGAEGYHGLDVVRAARICSAGRGGQILMSETTRALLGNAIPDGVEIVDLGAQRLKGLEDERLFQLILAEAPAQDLELKTERTPRPSHAEVLGADFNERVQRFVDQQLERSLGSVREPALPQAPAPAPKNTAAILGVIFGGLTALALVALLVVVLAVR
jgi:class 3 adenylate cyclase